jgi:GT2 family glycosyltransferase
MGGFDEAFFLYEEETEWQYRARKSGWLTYMHPGAKVLHNHHSSTGKMGKIFVYYHEFRSRIIFDHKRFKGLKYLIRILLIETGLALRVIYFSFRSLFRRELLIKLRAYYDLFKFNSLPKAAILNSRFVFEKKKNIFQIR